MPAVPGSYSTGSAPQPAPQGANSFPGSGPFAAYFGAQPTSTNPSGLSIPGGQTAIDDLYGARAGLAGIMVPMTAPGVAGSQGSSMPYDQAMAEYYQMDMNTRMAVQMQMYDGGLLTKEDDANGFPNPAGFTAWKTVVDEALSARVPVNSLLDWSQTTGSYVQVQAELAKAVTSLQSAISAPKSLGYTYTDPNVLRDNLTAAWVDALGYAPSDTQVNTFVNSFHGAETGAATAQLSADKSAASQTLARDQRLQSQLQALSTGGVPTNVSNLKALGPDGLGSFLTAYRQVIASHAAQMGINPQQGPMTAPAVPGTNRLAPTTGTQAPQSYAGAQGAQTLNQQVGAAPAQPGVLGQIGYILSRPFSGGQQPTAPGPFGTPATPAVNTYPEAGAPNQNLPGGAALPHELWNALPATYGGIYGLRPDAWAQGTQALGLTQYANPAAAPEQVQTAVAAWYAQQQFQQYGNWGDVASMMAGGKPLAESQSAPVFGVQNGKFTMDAFANQIVNQVDQAINAIQTELTQPGPTVAVGRELPNAVADAAAAARTSDPTQFIAHQASLLYGFLDRDLYGSAPVEAKQPTDISGMSEAQGAPMVTAGAAQ